MPVNPRPPLERLMNKITIDAETGCWLWAGAPRSDGYAQIKVSGKMQLVHRVSYEAHVGPIPAGLEIDHLCRNRSCSNPAHLEAVTPQENQRRSNSFAGVNARATHCKRGHPFDEANTFISSGRRRCKTCHRAAGARARAKATVR